MRRRLCLIFLLIGSSTAFPAERVPLNYDRIDLRDGRTLENVVIKTYDARTGRLLLLADGKAMIIPISLLPPPYNEALKKAPPSGGTSSSTSAPAQPHSPQARSREQFERDAAESKPEAASQAEREQDKIRSAHQEKAQERATNFYQIEYQPGSNNITVTVLSFESSRPQVVEGWPNRFRTEGKAYLEYYNSVAHTYDRSTSTYEVLTEQKPGDELKVIQFLRKS